jgi:hypothetical protein
MRDAIETIDRLKTGLPHLRKLRWGKGLGRGTETRESHTAAISTIRAAPAASAREVLLLLLRTLPEGPLIAQEIDNRNSLIRFSE